MINTCIYIYIYIEREREMRIYTYGLMATFAGWGGLQQRVLKGSKLAEAARTDAPVDLGVSLSF